MHIWRGANINVDIEAIRRLWKKTSVPGSIRVDHAYDVISWQNESERSPELVYSAIAYPVRRTVNVWRRLYPQIPQLVTDDREVTFYQMLTKFEHLLYLPDVCENLAVACREYYRKYLDRTIETEPRIPSKLFAGLTPPRALVEREYRASYASGGSHHLWELTWGHVSSLLVRARTDLPRRGRDPPGTLFRGSPSSTITLHLFVLADSLCASPYRNELLIAQTVIAFPGQIHSVQLAAHPILRIISCMLIRKTNLIPCPEEYREGILASAGRTGEFARFLAEAREAWCDLSVV